jgi:hypothetical protein
VFDATNNGGSSTCGVRCRWLCLIERLRPGTRPSPMVETPPQQQPLLAAIRGDGDGISKGAEASSGPSSTSRDIGFERTAPVMIDRCSFTASAIELVGSVVEFPVAFAQALPLTFDEAAAEASAWCAGRARADSAWAAAAVSRCTFNGAAQESNHGNGGEEVLPVTGAHAAASSSSIGICVLAAADVALSLRDCVFGGKSLLRHSVPLCCTCMSLLYRFYVLCKYVTRSQ